MCNEQKQDVLCEVDATKWIDSQSRTNQHHFLRTRHASSHGMNGKSYFFTRLDENIHHFLEWILSMRPRNEK
jgi:hypothetical protein